MTFGGIHIKQQKGLIGSMKIKFIKYDGSFPNFCSGTCIMEVDGELYSFGGYPPFDDPEHEFPSFWTSGGSVWFDANWEDHVEVGPWELCYDADLMPDWFKEHDQEFIDVFNEHVPYGCCGGCV